jgi:hypothetical protein
VVGDSRRRGICGSRCGVVGLYGATGWVPGHLADVRSCGSVREFFVPPGGSTRWVWLLLLMPTVRYARGISIR